MRLLVLLPDLGVMARPVAQAAAIVFLLVLFLGGCSALGSLSSGPAAPAYYPSPSTLYLKDGMPITARMELLDRYACAVDKPLVCQCVGRVGSTCDCHC